MNHIGSSRNDWLRSICLVETAQQSAAQTPISSPVIACDRHKHNLNIVPRRPANIFDEGYYLKPLLPDRYPTADLPLKAMEYNFYPDLNQTRGITAVVTETPWAVQCDPRPNPRVGVTVYF